jgi:hypothetical protein
VICVQTYGNFVSWNPHLHCIALFEIDNPVPEGVGMSQFCVCRPDFRGRGGMPRGTSYRLRMTDVRLLAEGVPLLLGTLDHPPVLPPIDVSCLDFNGGGCGLGSKGRL